MLRSRQHNDHFRPRREANFRKTRTRVWLDSDLPFQEGRILEGTKVGSMGTDRAAGLRPAAEEHCRLETEIESPLLSHPIGISDTWQSILDQVQPKGPPKQAEARMKVTSVGPPNHCFSLLHGSGYTNGVYIGTITEFCYRLPQQSGRGQTRCPMKERRREVEREGWASALILLLSQNQCPKWMELQLVQCWQEWRSKKSWQ